LTIRVSLKFFASRPQHRSESAPVSHNSFERRTKMPLPLSATITIKDQKPDDNGMKEVTPDGGRIIFDNKDHQDYRLRFHITKTQSTIDLLLPAKGQTIVLIKKDDEFMYDILNVDGTGAALSASAAAGGPPVVVPLAGTGGGPIRN